MLTKTNSRRKKTRGQNKRAETQHDNLLKKAADLLNTPADEFQIFGDFVANELRNLNSRDYQRQLKLQIQRAIITFSELNFNSPSTRENSASSTRVHSSSSTSANSSYCSSRPQSTASYYSIFGMNENEEGMQGMV